MQAVRDGTSRDYTWDAALAAPTFNRVENETTVQYWFDDARSLGLKYAYAKAQGLRGIGSWNIDCLAYNTSDPREREDTLQMWAAMARFREP
jgi:di-N-acetylchitobiase